MTSGFYLNPRESPRPADLVAWRNTWGPDGILWRELSRIITLAWSLVKMLLHVPLQSWRKVWAILGQWTHSGWHSVAFETVSASIAWRW
jgi:hypothetical protein